MNIQRITAIFEKDLKDFMKNSMLVFLPFLPIFMAFIFSKTGENLEETLPFIMVYVVIGVAYGGVTSNFIMYSMAEEKEKNTLRGLMLSPASFIDIIVGKSLVAAFITFISLFVSLFIIGIDPYLNAKTLLGLLILFFFFLFLGITVGLFVKTVGITTVYMMPILFIFGMTPMFTDLFSNQNGLSMKIIQKFPIPQLIKMEETGTWQPLGIVLIWTVVAGILMYITFQKAKADD